MKHQTSIISTILSTTILLSSTLSAQARVECQGGHCHITLPNKKDFKEVPSFLKRRIRKTSKSFVETVKLSADKYIAKAGEVLEAVNEMETIFASSYIMNEAEREIYYKQEAEEQRLREEAKNKHDAVLVRKSREIEKIIIEKTDDNNTPTSEFYCEKNKKVRILKDKESFECV